MFSGDILKQPAFVHYCDTHVLNRQCDFSLEMIHFAVHKNSRCFRSHQHLSFFKKSRTVTKAANYVFSIILVKLSQVEQLT